MLTTCTLCSEGQQRPGHILQTSNKLYKVKDKEKAVGEYNTSKDIDEMYINCKCWLINSGHLCFCSSSYLQYVYECRNKLLLGHMNQHESHNDSMCAGGDSIWGKSQMASLAHPPHDRWQRLLVFPAGSPLNCWVIFLLGPNTKCTAASSRSAASLWSVQVTLLPEKALGCPQPQQICKLFTLHFPNLDLGQVKPGTRPARTDRPFDFSRRRLWTDSLTPPCFLLSPLKRG